MRPRSAEAAVRRLFELFEARSWEAAKELLAADFVADWPHTGERFVGRDAFVDMQRAYPEGWRITVQDVVASGHRVASVVRVDHGERTFYAASFFEARGGALTRAVEYWVEASAEQPPPWRRRFTAP